MNRKPILIVDGDPDDVEIMKEVLTNHDPSIPVYHCANVNEALHFL